MKNIFLLLSLITFSFSQNNIDMGKYKTVIDQTTKESFAGMVKDYKKNAASNYKEMQESDAKMREKYGIKGISGKNRKKFKNKFIEDKFASVKKLSQVQKKFIEANNLNSLFISILELKAVFSSDQKMTKEQVLKYREKSSKNKASSSIKFFNYKNNFVLELNNIQECYLNSVDFMAFSRCEKDLDTIKNSEKIKRFITNYMK